VIGILFATAGAAPLMDSLATQLERAQGVFAEQSEAPHYIALAITEEHSLTLSANAGTIELRDEDTSRWLDVDLRVGSPALDSTHPLRGFSAMQGESRQRVRLPLDDGYALDHALSRELDARYREAAEHMVVLRTNQQVLVEEESSADDFEPRPPVTDSIEIHTPEVDIALWEDRLRAASARADRSPDVHTDQVRLSVITQRRHFLDTEGTSLVDGRTHARLLLDLSTTAEDGDEVRVFDAFDVHDPAQLPTELDAWVDAQVQRLEALREAPRGEPYSGPVILQGRAAAVFFHEVLGHRVEGHRQKREDEGKTFAEHVGEPILPPFIKVVDDPRVPRLEGVDLNGFYRYDDEGTPAMPAILVDDGVFSGFLMGRSPLPNGVRTNGHGRRSTGNPPTSRMGNTLVSASKTLSSAALREQLLAQVRAQGLEYGTIVDDIEGGFALTGRMMPNAFNIRAVASWRVYADGRPDELIRGVDLVGTPFAAFSNLLAADDTPKVFNGTCGAESGWVPVSAVAPAILFERLEFQLKEKGQDRPPLLPKPHSPNDGSAEASP